MWEREENQPTRARPHWNSLNPSSDEIEQLLHYYIQNHGLILPEGFKVVRFASGRFNFLYLITTNPEVPRDGEEPAAPDDGNQGNNASGDGEEGTTTSDNGKDGNTASGDGKDGTTSLHGNHEEPNSVIEGEEETTTSVHDDEDPTPPVDQEEEGTPPPKAEEGTGWDDNCEVDPTQPSNTELDQNGLTFPALKIKGIKGDLLLRVKMPWAPYYALENEVANTLYAAQLDIPVPTIHAFDSSAKNDLGIEFMIIDRAFDTVTAKSKYEEKWRWDPTWTEIKPLISTTQDFISRLWAKDWPQIGSLYCDWTTIPNGSTADISRNLFVGPLVDCDFFGPFLFNTHPTSPTKSPPTSNTHSSPAVPSPTSNPTSTP